MKRLISLTLIFSVYLGLIAPIGNQIVLEANAQRISGTRNTIMNQTMLDGLQFRLSEGEAGRGNARETTARENRSAIGE
jgi:hypothetical protein